MSRRVAVGNLIDSIDFLDPSSRNRQISSLQRLEARFFGRRMQRTFARCAAYLTALTLLVAYFNL